MEQAMNSPFRYAGGKFYARKLILDYILPHTLYIEPFAGGASIFFAKKKSPQTWLNDLDADLINVYHTIRDKADELVRALQGEVATKERHTYYKNEFPINNELERAVRWYYLNRTSYSGIMNMKNCFWGYGDKYSMRPENWGRNILRTSAKLQGVRLSCLDFEAVIEQADNNAFLFIDPPYFNADQDKFYNQSFTKEQHYRLSEVLQKHAHRLKFLLTYDNSPQIRELYSWTQEMHDKTWNYTINRTDDQKKTKDIKNGTAQKSDISKGSRYKGREVFIFNYACPVQETPSLFSYETAK